MTKEEKIWARIDKIANRALAKPIDARDRTRFNRSRPTGARRARHWWTEKDLIEARYNRIINLVMSGEASEEEIVAEMHEDFVVELIARLRRSK